MDAAKITTKYITAADVEAMELEDKLIEISEGQWEQQTMATPEHARLGLKLGSKLLVFVDDHELGAVYGADVTFVLEGTPENIITMRLPDVSYVAAARVQKITKGYYYLAPDLAVEIISPSERPAKVNKKLLEYLQAGVKQVWLVYMEKKEIIVHLADGTHKTYGETNVIPGGDVLPGFELKLSSLFK